ncbi:hypothetical protein CY652_05685 [Burkholderia sp. WAC0059]|uniref:PqiC family protein n=1 Tax=Burkholderia sp. WAC0059 TaxID=2066022 RepID=UPI000C7EA4A0|nr:hypothetical protein CY652_05685 [Burkholderia sp. WAC0059]
MKPIRRPASAPRACLASRAAGVGTATANPPWLIALAPVDVPALVQKNQLVVQRDAARVDVLEQERWASLPGDEIRRALSGDLMRQLGTIDVYGTPYPGNLPVYRVSVNVARFESWPGSHALIDAVWSVRSLRARTSMTCRSVISEPVGAGYEALVDGHRRAVEALATAISGGVRTLADAPPANRLTNASSSDEGMTSIACPVAAPSAGIEGQPAG